MSPAEQEILISSSRVLVTPRGCVIRGTLRPSGHPSRFIITHHHRDRREVVQIRGLDWISLFLKVCWSNCECAGGLAGVFLISPALMIVVYLSVLLRRKRKVFLVIRALVAQRAASTPPCCHSQWDQLSLRHLYLAKGPHRWSFPEGAGSGGPWDVTKNNPKSMHISVKVKGICVELFSSYAFANCEMPFITSKKSVLFREPTMNFHYDWWWLIFMVCYGLMYDLCITQ